MAKVVYEGATSSGATVSLKKAANATSSDLMGCDAVIFGTPNYFDYMAGAIKDFFDRTFYELLNKVDDKPYAAFSSGGGSSKGALDSVEGICRSLRLKKAFEGIISVGKPSSNVLDRCKELGRKMAQLQPK